MRRKKNKYKTLTFTIMSNDAKKVVTRLQLPRLSVFVMSLFVVVPIILLFYFVTINFHHQQENSKLTATLDLQTNKVGGLQEKLDDLEEQRTEVQNKIKQLSKLESQMKEYMTELPMNLESSGGISITVPEKEVEGVVNLSSSELVERYKETIAEMEVTNNKLKHLPTAWPANSYTITSKFGIRNDPFNRISSFHSGIDIGGTTGTPVYAGGDGTVIKAEHYSSYGKAIIIRHSNTYETLYGHLSEIQIEQGDTVKKGDRIGSIGSTGRSTGPHLHYEVIKNGEPIDPYPYMNFFTNNDEQH